MADRGNSTVSGDRFGASAPIGDAAPARPIRLCVVVTVDVTLINLCRGRFEHFMARGFEVTAVCAPTARADEILARGVRLVTAPLTRRVSPMADLRAVWRLYRFFRREKFDIIEVSTPKAALVGSIAARLAGAKCVVHLLRGLAYEGQGGFRRWWLRLAHRVPCRLAHQVICVSRANLEQGRGDRLFPADRGLVLGGGSSNGVDLERFRPPSLPERETARAGLGFEPDALVIGFVGRLTNDKGVSELCAAVRDVARTRPQVRLLVVGDFEAADRPGREVVEFLRGSELVRHAGWREDIARCLWAMDLLVLPTHREGLSNVLLEAGASGLPIVATQAAGWWDVIEAGREAVRVPAGDAAALAAEIGRLADDSAERSRLGTAVRAKVGEVFDCRGVWSMQEAEFRRLIGR